MSKLARLREYHRPTDLDEARRLLRRKRVRTVVLAGGTGVVAEAPPGVEAVVDLDGLGLDFIDHEDEALVLGAMLRLETIVEKLADITDGLLADAARRTVGLHTRNMATVGGVLAGGDIHSPLSVGLAALRARVRIYEQPGEMPLWADLSREIRREGLKGRLITAISLDLPGGALGASYQQVARTPADSPIVCAASVAVAAPGGDFDAATAVGGLLHDLLVISQPVGAGDVDAALEAVAAEAARRRTPATTYQSDFRGSAEYRQGVAPLLAKRALLAALRRAGAPVQSAS